MANLERPWICFVFFFFCNHYVQASHLKIIYTYRHTIIFYIHLNTTNRMIQDYSRRTWLCLIIIPLRKYKNNLINRHFGAAAAQMDLVFVVAMRTGEHCVSVTDTEHGASVQFYFGDGENSSIDQSVAIFFIKPHVLITLYMQLSLPLQSPNLSPPRFLFCNHACVALHRTEYYNVSSRGWKRVIKPPSSCSSFVQ